MHKTRRRVNFTTGNRTLLVLSITAALATMTSTAAQAGITISGGGTLSGGALLDVTWSGGGSLVIDNSVAISASTAFTANGTNGSLTNDGAINGTAIGLSNLGTLTSLNNDSSGSITGPTALSNTGTIGTLTNAGSIAGSFFAIANQGSIGTLNNNIGGTLSGRTGYNSQSSGSLGVLNNAGVISGTSYGFKILSGAITTVNNGGLIQGGTAAGIFLSASTSIGTLTNTGTISGAATGIENTGTISTLNNNGGTISGAVGISNTGTITTLNNSGLIRGTTNAIAINAVTFPTAASGTIGSFTNSGTISGSITNATTNNLSINGGSGSTFGTLTGSGSGVGTGNIGVITNTHSNVVFASGNQLLNDNINVGGNAVTNTGATLQVNNSITVTGNYSQTAGGTLNIGVANGAIATGVVSADSGYGRLVVTGNATFNSGSSVVLKPVTAYSFAQGQKFVVVQAATANYNAGALNYSATGYSGVVTGASVVDSGNGALTDLILTLGAGSSGSSSPIRRATNSDAVSSLNGLFSYNGTDANVLNMYNAAVALGSTAEANRAGAQLSPAANTRAAVQSSQIATQSIVNITSTHIDNLRVAQAGGSTGVATGERGSDVATWGQAFGGQVNQASSSSISGYNASYSGLLLGADTALDDRWRVGGVFSYANTSVSDSGDNAGSSAQIKAYGLMAYAGYSAERWYLNWAAGMVKQRYETQRNIGYTGFSGSAAGSFGGTQYVTSVQAGYPLMLDNATTLTPIAGVTYTHQSQDAYTETGSVAALRVNSASNASVKSDVGAKLERSYKTSYGEMTPSVQLSWRHEYRDTSMQSVANFAADSSGATSFTTQGAAANANTAVLVLGATLARSQNLTLAARYTLEAARGYAAQTADVRLRYQF